MRGIPPFDADVEGRGIPPAVANLKDQIAEADAIVIATPEYNHSISGVLKNPIDWASRPAGRSPLRDKPVLMMGVSTGRGGARRALDVLRQVLSAIGAEPLDLVVSARHRPASRDARGAGSAPDTRWRCRTLSIAARFGGHGPDREGELR